MKENMPSEKIFLIDKPAQISLLSSAMRQEILDSINALGPCSIAELAEELGVAADSLYYHIRKLVETGLLVQQEVRETSRRDEVVYALAGRNMHLKYEPDDPANVESITKIISAMLRMTERDFRAGFTPGRAIVEGETRNLWGSRLKAWLTDDDLSEVNQLLGRLEEIFHQPKLPGDRQLCTLTWVIAPKEAQARRRETGKEMA